MHRTIALAIIIIASISNCCAGGDDNITFTDAPYAVYVRPGSDATFNATLKNAGNGYADASVIVRSVPDCILVGGTNKMKLIRRGGIDGIPDHDPCKSGCRARYTPFRDCGSIEIR